MKRVVSPHPRLGQKSARLPPGLGILAVLSIGIAVGWLPRQIRSHATSSDAQEAGGQARTGKAAGLIPNDWFYVQRSFPGRLIAPQARTLALEQARAMKDRSRAPGEPDSPPSGGRSAWSEAGPVNIGGRITAVAVHPTIPGRIFVGAADGGVFRSTDMGANWEPVFDQIGTLSIGALAIDPQNPEVIYAGTGEVNASGDSFDGLGLFRSTDAGETWSWLGLEATRRIGRIVVDPQNSERIYVAAMGTLFSKNQERGVYRSTDFGANWDRVLFVSDSTGVIDLAIDPSQPSRLYAAAWERIRSPKHRRVGGVTSGIYRTTDGGENWSLLSLGLPPPGPTVGRIGLALAVSNPQVMYAIYADDPGNFAGLYKTTNGGTLWTRTNDGALSDLYSSYGWYFGNVRVSPTDPNRVYALGLDIYRSANGGTSWSGISSGVHVDQHDLWIDPGSPARLIAAGDGGAYTSTTDGFPWEHVETLPITQFYAITVDALQPFRLYGGSQDNGTVRTWTGALDDWDLIYGGDGFYCLVDPRNSNVIYAEYQYGGLAKSINGGASFSSATNGIPGNDRRNWSTPVVMDPSNPDVLYYGTYRVFRSTNGAGNWNAISGDLTGGPAGATLVYATLTTLAVAPSDPARIYAGTDDARVWTTSNGGGSWQNVSAGLPNRWVTRVLVDPVNPQIAYVAHSGYRNDSPLPHLHRTTNAGLSWTPIDAGLPEAPVNALVLDPESPGTIYAGTDTGVYVSRNAGQTWDEAAAGLPLVVVHDLVFHASSRTLVAGTHGRSMYKLAVPPTSGVGDGLADGTDRGRGLTLEGPSMGPARPNPFRIGSGGSMRLFYRLPRAEAVLLGVYDLAGRLRRTLPQPSVVRARIEGEVEFDGRDDRGAFLPAGTYFLRLTSASGSVVQPLTLIR